MDGEGNSDHNPSAQGWTMRAGTISALVGPFWERRVDGDIQIGLVCEPRHDNGRGNMHGGLLMTLVDMGMGAAVRSAGDEFQCATVQLDVAFLQTVAIGEFVTTECHVKHKTNRMAFVSGALKVGERTVASAQGVFKLLARPAPQWQGG